MNAKELSLADRARAWMAADVCEEDQAAVLAMLEAKQWEELGQCFAAELEFGTAGLRGLEGVGPNRMNRAVVRRASYALALTLDDHVPDAKKRGVVVGYDARRGSEAFALETAGVLLAAGFTVRLFEREGPTPLAAHALLRHKAAAAVVVTASHNPPAYNGYKVYWANGAQILSPIDVEIFDRIVNGPAAKDIPCVDGAEARQRSLVVGKDDSEAFLSDLLQPYAAGASTDAPIVYTAMHGVGARHTMEVLARGGFSHVVPVPEQVEPDAAFPTVAFPNPEEPGAMDLAFRTARDSNAPLILANDPDADRLAVAERASDGSYVQLTGNQVGVLLGDQAIATSTVAHPLVVNSFVSSPMLGAIAKARGVRFEETLTGFKWIENRALELERNEGLQLIFGYEEALGYAVNAHVRDKDGVGAALAMANLWRQLRARGQTLLGRLDELYREFGLYVGGSYSLTYQGADAKAQIDARMAALRANVPTKLGGLSVSLFADLLDVNRPGDIHLPPSDVLLFRLGDDGRVLVRPSGTEPKCKVYIDVREPVRDGEPVSDARARAESRSLAIRQDVLVAMDAS